MVWHCLQIVSLQQKQSVLLFIHHLSSLICSSLNIINVIHDKHTMNKTSISSANVCLFSAQTSRGRLRWVATTWNEEVICWRTPNISFRTDRNQMIWWPRKRSNYIFRHHMTDRAPMTIGSQSPTVLHHQSWNWPLASRALQSSQQWPECFSGFFADVPILPRKGLAKISKIWSCWTQRRFCSFWDIFGDLIHILGHSNGLKIADLQAIPHWEPISWGGDAINKSCG